MATTYSGFQVGPFFMLLLSGLECDHLGWQWVFYLTGAPALIVGLLWLGLYSSGPESSPIVTDAETEHILKT